MSTANDNNSTPTATWTADPNTSPSPVPNSARDAASRDAIDAALGIFRVLETGDPDLARRVAAPTFFNREANVSPLAASLPGPQGLLASSAWMRSAFAELHFSILSVGESDGQVWVHLRMQGLHSGAFVQYADGVLAKAIPPTGRRIDFEQIHVLTIEGGEVTRHEAVRDDITMLSQLNVFPPTPKMMARIIGWVITGRAKKAAVTVSEAAERATVQVPGFWI